MQRGDPWPELGKLADAIVIDARQGTLCTVERDILQQSHKFGDNAQLIMSSTYPGLLAKQICVGTEQDGRILQMYSGVFTRVRHGPVS